MPPSFALIWKVVFEEMDRRFRLSLRKSADASRMIVELQSRDASEIWALPFADARFGPGTGPGMGLGVALGVWRKVFSIQPGLVHR